MLLVLGTHNRKKGSELHQLLEPFGIQLKTLEDFSHAIEVVEDGDSFAMNARSKASQQARHLNEWVLGEDSGLCVDALQGRPGIFSARYAGTQANDQSNNARLLEELQNVPFERRTAHYVCHMSLADPHGDIRLDCEEQCRGIIATSPRGDGGFGYDPLFEIAEYHQTFGELGTSVKSALSHRSRAMRCLVPQLLKLFSACGDTLAH